MSMHLEGPWLSTTGKRKGKQKFRSSESARKARELSDLWIQKQKEWQKLSPRFGNTPIDPTESPKKSFPSYSPPPGRETPKINSLPFTGGPCA